MAMHASNISGCCISKNFYDLGRAHGRDRYKDTKEFAKRLLELSPSRINIAITNGSQEIERKYLEDCGFKEVFKAGSLTLHAADSTNINKVLAGIKEELKQERLEKEKARIEHLKKLRASGVRQVYTWHIADLKAKSLRNGIRDPKVAIEQEYGVSPNLIHDRWYMYKNSDLARTVNRHLAKQVPPKLKKPVSKQLIGTEPYATFRPTATT